MLAKLIKHEFKATALPMLIITAVLLVMPLFEAVLIAFSSLDTDVGIVFTFLSVINMLAQLLVASAAVTVGYVFVAVRFYSHTYGPQGYLTLMLPAKRSSILFSKLFTSAVWLVIHCILSVFGILIPLMFIDFGFGTSLIDIMMAVYSEMYSSVVGYILLLVLVSFVSLLNMIATMYFSVSLGQLFRKNRIFAAVLIYFGIYSIQYTINMIISFVTSLTAAVITPEEIMMTADYSSGITLLSVALTGAVSLVFFIVQYLLTSHILKKRVNLQ